MFKFVFNIYIRYFYDFIQCGGNFFSCYNIFSYFGVFLFYIDFLGMFSCLLCDMIFKKKYKKNEILYLNYYVGFF